MQKILRKRILRDLKENLFRYLALGFLVILGMYMVISVVGAAETIMTGTKDVAKENRVEDGQFSLFVPLTEEEKSALEEDGITLESHFYLDYSMEDDSVLRVFSQRKKIDLPQADYGRMPQKSGEILLEKRYCEEHDISVEDEISVGGHRFWVCGIGSSPDYDTPHRNLSDSAVDSSLFGVGFLSEEDYQRLNQEKKGIRSEEYIYSYLLNGKMTEKKLKEKLQELDIGVEELSDGISEFSGETRDFLDENQEAKLSKLTQFLPADDNPRIEGAANDKFVDKAAGLAAGVIVLILFAYVISVFVVHSIEQEAGIIGTFYAMGVRKNELLRHYLALPVLITLVAGIVGTALGYSDFGARVQMEECYGYFSIPVLDTIYKPYLLVYGIVMPPVVAALTNFLVIRGKLERPVLSLIRNEQKNGKTQDIQIHSGSFVHVFQVRQLLREKRSAFTMFFGMFISLLVVMLSLNCYVLCEHIRTENRADTRFAYMYSYKYPEEQVPEGGEAAYGVTLKKEVLGYNLDVTLLGIEKDNPYFQIVNEGEEAFGGENTVQISSAMAQKYHLRAGDDLVLKDEENDRNYAFTIQAVVPYSTSFFAFMDIDSMRELMGEDADYYNIVFADHALPIDSGRLYAATSKDEIEENSSVFVEQMMPMVSTLTMVSALIFVVVMYLMMKVMIDRSAMSISLMKVFGYRKKEIRKLYLNGNLLVVAASALLGIPLSKIAMDAMYPYLVSNIACGINLAFSWQMYAGIFGAILILYFIMNRILMRRVNKILPAEVLKNRE